MALSLEAVKGLCVLGLFLVAFLPALIPVVVQQFYRRRRGTGASNRKLIEDIRLFTSSLSCFGAGVFVGTFFFDMLGEVRDAVEQWFKAAKIDWSFPLAEVFAVTGFIFVMLLEQVTVLISQAGRTKRQQQSDNNSSFVSVLRALILFMVLSLHSVFEGMAVGLLDTVQATVTLFSAVCIHDAINSFCLGLRVLNAGLRPLYTSLSLALYAAIPPVGVGIGMAIRTAPPTLSRYGAVAVLQGLASGSFLYIAFVDILPRELFQTEKENREQSLDSELVFASSTVALASEKLPSIGVELSTNTAIADPVVSPNIGKSPAGFVKIFKCLCFAAGVCLMAFVIHWSGHEHGETQTGNAINCTSLTLNDGDLMNRTQN